MTNEERRKLLLGEELYNQRIKEEKIAENPLMYAIIESAKLKQKPGQAQIVFPSLNNGYFTSQTFEDIIDSRFTTVGSKDYIPEAAAYVNALRAEQEKKQQQKQQQAFFNFNVQKARTNNESNATPFPPYIKPNSNGNTDTQTITPEQLKMVDKSKGDLWALAFTDYEDKATEYNSAANAKRVAAERVSRLKAANEEWKKTGQPSLSDEGIEQIGKLLEQNIPSSSDNRYVKAQKAKNMKLIGYTYGAILDSNYEYFSHTGATKAASTLSGVGLKEKHGIINGTKISDSSTRLYTQLTKTEKQTWNYYIGRNETEKAIEYLDVLAPTLEARLAETVSKEYDEQGVWGDAKQIGAVALGGLEKGIYDMASSIYGTTEIMNGNSMADEFVPGFFSPSQMELLTNEILANEDGEDGRLFNIILSAINSTAYQAPSLLISAAGGGMTGYVLQSIGANTTQAIRVNSESFADVIHGVYEGTMEWLVDKTLGGVSSQISGKGASSFTKSLLNKVDDVLTNPTVKKWASKGIIGTTTIASENLEELIQFIADPLARAVIYGEELDYSEATLANVLELLAVTSISTLMMSPASTNATYNQHRAEVTGQSIIDTGKIDALLQFAQDFDADNSDTYDKVWEAKENNTAPDALDVANLYSQVMRKYNTISAEDLDTLIKKSARSGNTKWIADSFFNGNTEAANKFAKSRTDNTNGEREYSIELDADGNTYVQVDEDIFAENDGKSVASVIANVISTKFNNLISANGQNIQINKTTNDEWRRSTRTVDLYKTNPIAHKDKLRTIANADEILTAAKDWIGEQIKHQRNDDIIEFARGNVNYKVGDNGYSADVLVGIRQNGAAVLYDLINIYEKQITAAPVTRASQSPPRSQNATVTGNNISQPVAGVNTNSSQSRSIFDEPDLTTSAPKTAEQLAMEQIAGIDSSKTDGQRRVESIARILHQKVEWYESDDVTDRGYYENGVVHINKKANQAYTVVFTHEFLHHLQTTNVYKKFVEFVKGTQSYKNWIAQQGGYDTFAASIKKNYESRTGKTMSPGRLDYEIMARFISEGFFTEADLNEGGKGYNFFTEIAQNHHWYNRVIDWIEEMINRLRHRNEQADFIKMQRLLKAAYSQVQSRTAEQSGAREGYINDVSISQADIENNINAISQMSSVKDMSGTEFAKGDTDLVTQVENYFESFGKTVNNSVLGDVEITARSAKDSIAHGIGRNKAIAFAAVPEVIRNGKIIDFQQNWKGRGYDTVVIAAPVTINKAPFYEGVIVIREKDNQRFYLHEVLTERRTDSPFKTGTASNSGTPGGKSSPSVISLLEKIWIVKENIGNETREHSIDMDENGEVSYTPEKYIAPDGTERIPPKLYAKDLLHQEGSTYNREQLSRQIQRIYEAADKGQHVDAAILAEKVAANILDDVPDRDFSQEGENAADNATRALANKIMKQVNTGGSATVNRMRSANRKTEQRAQKAEDKNAELERTINAMEHDRAKIRKEEREKVEAAQQRKTDRNAVIRSVNRLDKKFRANSNTKHVHEDLKPVIEEFLDIFLKNAPQTFEKRNVHKLRTIYNDFVKNQKDLTLDPDTEEKIDYLAKIMDGKSLSDLSNDELKVVRELAEHFEHLVTTANEIFLEGRKEDFRAIANEEAERLKQLKDKKEIGLGTGKIGKAFDEIKEFIIEGNLKPVYFFEKIGGVYKKLFDGISEGMDKTINNINKTKDMLQKAINNYDYWSWVDKNQKIELGHPDGQKITLTIGEAMSVLATYKRERSNKDTQDSNHLSQGGIVLKTRQIVEQIENEGKAKNGSFDKLMQRYLVSAWASSPYIITETDIQDIRKQLGKDKEAFVDELVNIMSTFGAELGNEASNKLYGYSKFGEPYYFPYETSNLFLERELDKKQAHKTLTGKSFTKNTVEAANTPLVISDFTEVFCKHMTEMCEYNGLAVPIDNLKRITRFTERADKNKAAFSLINELNRAYGAAAVNYLNKFIEDVDGGIAGQHAGDNVASGLMNMFQKNAVAANMSVTIQQPSSIARVLPYLEYRYLKVDKGTFNGETWEECKEYCPIAIQKEMGRFDIGNPKSTFDFMMDRQYDGIKNKAKGFFKDENYRDNVLSIGAAKADQLTWCMIWNGCKAKVQATTNLTGEALKIEAAKIFKEVIEHTQVYDSVLSRSQNMRSKSIYTRMVTAFRGEPTTNLNMFYKMIWDVQNKDFKSATKCVVGVVSATLLNALLKSLVTAARDDEEDKRFGEKYITEVGANFRSDINPANWIPLVSDVQSIFEGYQVKRADMEIIEDLYYGLKSLSSTEKTTWDKLLAVANPLSAIFGMPLKNILRDIGAVSNVVKSFGDDELDHTHGIKYALKEGFLGEKTYAEYYELLRDYQHNGKKSKYDELREYLLGRGKTEKEIESGVKSAYAKSKDVTKQSADYFERLHKTLFFDNLDEDKQKSVESRVKSYLADKAMSEDAGKEMSSANKKAAQAEKNGSSAAMYFLARAGFKDTDNSGGISNEEKISAINKMDISSFEKAALIALYTK